MRILFFLPDLDGGGAQRTVVNLVNTLTSEGNIGIRLVSGRSDGAASDWLDPTVDHVSLGKKALRHTVPGLRRSIMDFRPDVVMSTMADANVIAILATRCLPHPPAVILRETNSHRARGDIGLVRKALIGWAYRRADAVVALSSGVGEELSADYGIPPERMHIIHNPVDLDHFAGARVRTRAPDDGPLVIAIGRLCRQKGFDILIDAFGKIEDSRAQLAILGEGPDRIALECQIGDASLESRVSMPGFQADVAAWLKSADAFVLSSRWEGFGHVIVEAMACGVPVVSTRCPHGPADIIDDGENGLLVPVGDAAALAAALDRILADRTLAERLADNAAKGCRRFSVGEITHQYLDLFKAAGRASRVS